MKEKLIVTLWKAQLQPPIGGSSIYCRVTYNAEERNSKPSSSLQNMTWKETYVFTLSKKDCPLKLEFISLTEGETVHFAKDHIAQTLSFGRSTLSINPSEGNRGSLPCKLDIFDEKGHQIGKVFIEYQAIKTEVEYTVQRQLDYLYLLKLNSFKVTFLRPLKNAPNFFLQFLMEGRVHKEDFCFDEAEQSFVYHYPVKLYMKNEPQLQIELTLKDNSPNDFKTPNDVSFTDSIISKKTDKSRKEKNLLEIGKQKISALLDLTFKKDLKMTKKLPLSMLVKHQKREIGSVEIELEVFFKTQQELLELEQQKKALANPEQKPTDKKKQQQQQHNGQIILNSVIGKLELFNEQVIKNRNISLSVKLGRQDQQSSILDSPGKELIFIDTFIFRRTWEETIKLVVEVHNSPHERIPTFFAEVNLRELFQSGRYSGRRVKLIDQRNNYSGELVLDIVYTENEPKKMSESRPSKVQQSTTNTVEIKRQQIQQRLQNKEEEKLRAKQMKEMSALAILKENDIILPPLKSYRATLSPSARRGGQVYNTNGALKFNRAARFESTQKQSYESFAFVRDSDFDVRKSRGASISSSLKSDFTKHLAVNPGVGRYNIPSTWDKYI